MTYIALRKIKIFDLHFKKLRKLIAGFVRKPGHMVTIKENVHVGSLKR